MNSDEKKVIGADPGFSERGGCTDVGDLEGAARPLPTRGVWGNAPQKNLKSRSSEMQFPAFWASKGVLL